MQKFLFFHFLCDLIRNSQNTYILNFWKTHIDVWGFKFWRKWCWWLENNTIFDDLRANCVFWYPKFSTIVYKWISFQLSVYNCYILAQREEKSKKSSLTLVSLAVEGLKGVKNGLDPIVGLIKKKKKKKIIFLCQLCMCCDVSLCGWLCCVVEVVTIGIGKLL